MHRHRCQACGAVSGDLDGPGLCRGCRAVIPVHEMPRGFAPTLAVVGIVLIAVASLLFGMLIGSTY